MDMQFIRCPHCDDALAPRIPRFIEEKDMLVREHRDAGECAAD